MHLRKRFLFLVLYMFGPPAACAGEAPALSLSQHGDVVYVVLANLGHQGVKVRRDYVLDRLLGSLSFDVRNENKVFPETAHINPEYPTNSTYLVLAPGELSGHIFDVWLIKSMHSLTSGCYTISAIYRDGLAKDFAAFDGELRSNAIKLCVSERDKPHHQ